MGRAVGENRDEGGQVKEVSWEVDGAIGGDWPAACICYEMDLSETHGEYLPPSRRNDTTGENHSIREDRARDHTIYKETDLTKWALTYGRSGRKIVRKLIRYVEIPKLLISVTWDSQSIRLLSQCSLRREDSP